MIDACCDANFTKVVTECCWNVTHGRAPLSTHKIQQLKRQKALLQKLSNSSIPIKQRKIAIQRGRGFCLLMWNFQLLQQNNNLRPRVREPEQKKKYQWSTMHHMQEPQRARIKRTLDHIDEHDGNIKYDKYTGEIQYDGVKAPDSDVRELLSTLTSKIRSLYALIKGYRRTGGHTSRVEVE